MRTLKRAAALLLAAVLCISLVGCGRTEPGVDLAVCVGNGFSTLDPIYAEDIGSQTVLVHLYENLMRVTADSSGGTSVVNGMAKNVEAEENVDGTVTYTFTLRSARWSDGEKVQAADFVYAWQRLADPTSHSPYASLLRVVCGYQEARNSGDMSLLQVEAKSESALVVTLSGHYDWFLREVCTSPATMPLRQDVVQRLKETAQTGTASGTTASWWSDPTLLVTNGSYVAESYTAGSSLRLTANEQYHSSQVGPETLTFWFASSAEEAQTLYQEGVVDAAWPLTEERLAELAAEEATTPELETYTVLYNSNRDVFADQMVRQALSLAVDRNELAELAGASAMVAEGLVPAGVPENEETDFRTAGGALLENDPEEYEARCEQARELLSEAGYSGAGLGQLEYLYEDSGTNGAVAQALCRQWQEALGVQVTPRGVTFQELWTALRAGEYTLAGVDLEAPGNDAECFLMAWISDSYDNVVGYENSAYDTLMSIIARTEDGTARMGCLHDAEALLLGDYALIPLYTAGTAWELRGTLTGACRDARGWFDFSCVRAL